MTVDQHVKAINDARLKAQGGWWWYTHDDVKAKGYGTWVQRIEVGGIVDGCESDPSVGRFKAYLRNVLDFALPCEVNESVEA